MNATLDKVVAIISSSRPKKLVLLATFFVLVSSIPLVYLSTLLFSVEYTAFLLMLSIALPLLLTPVTIAILIKITKNLSYFKESLEEEIEKNKAKDIMLFEQARFVLMGEVIQNLSHQWKQPLNTINLALLNAKLTAATPEEQLKYFDIMESNTNYLASTIDDFMSFFDKRTYLELKTLEALIHEIRSIIDVHIKSHNVKLSILTDTINTKVMIASSIAQVILNLINNAKDALEQVDGEKNIILTFSTTSDSLEIVCCDNGSGIEESLREKIFHPYFTTKNKTQGTGIGLYMSKQIIQKIFSGTLELKKTQKCTTCFELRLPYSDNCKLEGIK